MAGQGLWVFRLFDACSVTYMDLYISLPTFERFNTGMVYQGKQ